MIDHIVVFENVQTQYNVLNFFLGGLREALESLGIRVSTVDQTVPWEKFIQTVYQNPPDCTLAFNGLLPTKEGKFLADELEIPHVAWIVDSAHHFPEFVHSPYTLPVFVDDTSRQIYEAWGKSSGFLVHAGNKKLLHSPETKRIYPIVFTGSLIDYLAIEEKWKTNLPKEAYHELLLTAEKVLKIEALPFQSAYQEILKGSSFFQKLDHPQTCALMNDFDLYIRGKDRMNLLKALQDFPLHIFGNASKTRGWDDFLKKKGSYVIHPSLPFDASLEVLKNSELVLNSSPMFKHGGHERIFNGFLAGALVVTNKTPWIKNAFTDDEIMTYPNYLEKSIAALLENPERRIAMATRGQKKVLERHTWDQRAKELLKFLEINLPQF